VPAVGSSPLADEPAAAARRATAGADSRLPHELGC